MKMRFAHDKEVEDWDDIVLQNPDEGNVFQGVDFAKQRQSQGWTPRYILSDTAALMALEKVVFGLGKIWYIPKGPGVETADNLAVLSLELRTFARKNGVFIVKIEPEIAKTDEAVTTINSLELISVRPIQQIISSIKIDLSPSLDDIMIGLNQKGRHAIRRAERDGVAAVQVPASDENCKIMYDLLAETAKGQFGIRNYDYYKTFWQNYEAHQHGQLFFAYYEDKVVAGAFAMIFGHKSTYKDGASVRERTAYGASHLLQWRVIEWAKSQGSLTHDLYGAPPSDQATNPEHAHYGIGRFKTSFNKHIIDYVGAYDLPVRLLSYKIWTKIGERIVMRLYYRKHHESYY